MSSDIPSGKPTGAAITIAIISAITAIVVALIQAKPWASNPAATAKPPIMEPASPATSPNPAPQPKKPNAVLPSHDWLVGKWHGFVKRGFKNDTCSTEWVEYYNLDIAKDLSSSKMAGTLSMFVEAHQGTCLRTDPGQTEKRKEILSYPQVSLHLDSTIVVPSIPDRVTMRFTLVRWDSKYPQEWTVKRNTDSSLMANCLSDCDMSLYEDSQLADSPVRQISFERVTP
jgi:hypothetical protein